METESSNGPDAEAPAVTPEDVVARQEQIVREERRNLVKELCGQINASRKKWETQFKLMHRWQQFARGLQWSTNKKDTRYVTNVTLRHVQQRVATLYAKNPKAVARRRERIINTVWDGKHSSLMAAQATVQQTAQMMAGQAAAMQNPEAAMMDEMGPPPQVQPQMMEAAAQAAAVIADADNVRRTNEQNDRIAKTLELLYQYYIDEQTHPFKSMMKLTVRRAVTTGVGYVKLGYQRVMDKSPDLESRISDMSLQLANLERLTADIADDQVDEFAAEKERVRLILNSLNEQQDMIIKEGLVFDYPNSMSIIPDSKCQNLRDFLGCDWVAQEYMLTRAEIQETYNIDVSAGNTGTKVYNKSAFREVSFDDDPAYTNGDDRMAGKVPPTENEFFRVWEVYHRKDGLVYHICDGYPNFLREPAAPEVYMERFFPWFPLVLNECDDPENVFPPSDVALLWHQQREINRMREGLREHRVANRPTVIVPKHVLEPEDRSKLQNRSANSIIELSMPPDEDVNKVLQSFSPPGVDPNLYEVQTTYDDIMRALGSSEASMGTAGGGVTATEVSQAESARKTSLASNIDDVDTQLTQIARAAGTVLLTETAAQTVTEIIGPGAVWPELSRMEAAQEIFLEIEAGSSGRPNQMQEIQNFERMAPIIQAIPGVNPEYFAKEAFKRLDDNFDLQQALIDGLPSMIAMNSMKAMMAPGGGAPQGGVPNGPEGGQNAQSPDRDSKADGPPPGGVAQPNIRAVS